MSLPPSGGAKRIGVALACCNQAHFLGDAIRSILAQTHRVDEIIVVDDGSCDATRQVSTSFPEVTYHFQENGGLSSARNTGLRLCGCERILFLDADDLLKPTAIADGMARFDEVPDAAFVYGGYMEVTEYRELMFARNAVEHEDAFAGLLLGNHVSMHGTVIYNAEMLRDSGGFDTGLKSCEDYDVFLRLARRHPIAAYDSIGAEYRRHGNNMTGNHIRMM
ncbi:MAG: glycosyltransferase family 2 protein, partial [Sphingobium sp.]